MKTVKYFTTYILIFLFKHSFPTSDQEIVNLKLSATILNTYFVHNVVLNTAKDKFLALKDFTFQW